MVRTATGEIMFSKCANPICGANFDYHQGTFFRFHKQQSEGDPEANLHSVQHFWLCGPCSRRYWLEYRNNAGIVLMDWTQQAPPRTKPRVIAAA